MRHRVQGPRISDWALTATGRPRQFLLIRRLLSRPDQLTFYLCWAPEGRPATMTYFITIAGRRWPAVMRSVEVSHPVLRRTKRSLSHCHVRHDFRLGLEKMAAT
ncbi:MAG TPA: hypothetical protein VGA04_00520 [Streptosporangiaceae bacterium]